MTFLPISYERSSPFPRHSDSELTIRMMNDDPFDFSGVDIIHRFEITEEMAKAVYQVVCRNRNGISDVESFPEISRIHFGRKSVFSDCLQVFKSHEDDKWYVRTYDLEEVELLQDDIVLFKIRYGL